MALFKKDRADDSFLTLVGDLPELITNLVKAEVDAAKKWLSNALKHGKWGALWIFVALFLLFWLIPALLAFTIIGLSSWMAPWVAALSTVGILLLAVVAFLLAGWLHIRRILKTENPVQAISTDARLVKEAHDE